MTSPTTIYRRDTVSNEDPNDHARRVAVLLCKSAASYSGANGASVYGYCLYIYMVFIYLYIYRTVTYITSPVSPKNRCKQYLSAVVEAHKCGDSSV